MCLKNTVTNNGKTNYNKCVDKFGKRDTINKNQESERIMLRIIIAGSRFFEDYNLFESTMFKVLFHLNKEYPQYNILVINKEERLFKINPCSLEIISGMAKGADTLAVRFANKYNLALKEFPADWNNLDVSPCRVITNSYGSYNALAGHKRNRDMAVYASSDDAFGVLVLFWDGKSKGSKNMKSQAVAFGLEIYENIINRQ